MSLPATILLLGAGFIVVLLAAILFITSALPGTSLYSVKVDRLERVMERFDSTPADQYERQFRLLERRQAEALRLASRSDISDEAIDTLLYETRRRTENIIAHIAQHTGGEFTSTQALLKTHQVSVLVRAQELTFQQNEQMRAQREDLTELRREVSGYVNGRIDQLLVHENESFINLFTTLLNDLLVQLERDEFSEDVRDGVELYVRQSELLIQDGQLSRALGAVLHAISARDLEKYIEL